MPRRRTSSGSAGAVAISMRPPAGIASRALTIRFTRTCSMSAGSATTLPIRASARLTTVTSSPTMRRSIPRRCSTSSFKSSSRGIAGCWREKAMSSRVRSAARSPALRISITSPRIGSVGRRRASTRSP
jgi:hypothetical protein